MFLPRVMRPLPAASQLKQEVQRIADASLSLVRGPSGTYLAEGLAAAIQSWDRWQGCVWLRTGNAAPDALADALACACVHRWMDDPEVMSSVSKPSLEQTLCRSPAGAMVVLEFRGWVSPGHARLLRDIRRVVADRGVTVIAVAEGRSPAARFGGPDCVISTAAFSEPRVVADVAELPTWCSGRLRKLAGHRAAIQHDVLAAAGVWPAEAIAEAFAMTSLSRSLLDQLTRNLLELASPPQRGALETCLATGYWHPDLATGAVQASELRPWIVPLEEQWGWLRPIWAVSLRRHLSPHGRWWQLSSARPRHRASPEQGQVQPPAPAVESTASPKGIVQARLFGAFELSVDGLAIDKWAGQRGTSVLRYLLSRHRHSCSRDELLDAFWPEVAPEVARNRLQVAVSGLRRALRGVTSLHVIEYAQGDYRINPALRVDVDVEGFEKSLSRARRAERSGDLDGALVGYREAIELYRGDFASDTPYEQWTLLPRESLRITYIDALDRVSHIQLSAGRLDDCIATGHRMLDVDPCREDAHRLLMRCYVSQGRTYQAIRQYEFCCRMLRDNLEVEPGPETTRLYRAIRASSAAKPTLID